VAGRVLTFIYRGERGHVDLQPSGCHRPCRLEVPETGRGVERCFEIVGGIVRDEVERAERADFAIRVTQTWYAKVGSGVARLGTRALSVT
jgi:hypothetical protein